MKKAVLLHGTGGSPESNWLPWLAHELEDRGYEVWVPRLPGNETPDRAAYNDFLLDNGWDFTDNLVVGHSSGAVSILNLLSDERCPKISTAVLVSGWMDTQKANLEHDGLTRERFKNLIPAGGFATDSIKEKSDRWLFLHGDDDPYCPLEQAEWLSKHTGGDLVVIPKGGHLNRTAGFSELPQLIAALEARGWL